MPRKRKSIDNMRLKKAKDIRLIRENEDEEKHAERLRQDRERYARCRDERTNMLEGRSHSCDSNITEETVQSHDGPSLNGDMGEAAEPESSPTGSLNDTTGQVEAIVSDTNMRNVDRHVSCHTNTDCSSMHVTSEHYIFKHPTDLLNNGTTRTLAHHQTTHESPSMPKVGTSSIIDRPNSHTTDNSTDMDDDCICVKNTTYCKPSSKERQNHCERQCDTTHPVSCIDNVGITRCCNGDPTEYIATNIQSVATHSEADIDPSYQPKLENSAVFTEMSRSEVAYAQNANCDRNNTLEGTDNNQCVYHAVTERMDGISTSDGRSSIALPDVEMQDCLENHDVANTLVELRGNQAMNAEDTTRQFSTIVTAGEAYDKTTMTCGDLKLKTTLDDVINTIERNRTLKRERACLLEILRKREEYMASKTLIEKEHRRVNMAVRRRTESVDERSRRLEKDRKSKARLSSVPPMPKNVYIDRNVHHMAQPNRPEKLNGHGDKNAQRSPYLHIPDTDVIVDNLQPNMRKRNHNSTEGRQLLPTKSVCRTATSEQHGHASVAGPLQISADCVTKRPRRELVTDIDIQEQYVDMVVDGGDSDSQVNEEHIITDSERIQDIREQLITSLGDDDFSYNSFKDNPLLESGREFYTEMEKTQWSTCINCHETWIHLRLGPRSNKCARCSGTRGKIFGDENDLNPGLAPDVLTRLTPIEKSAISMICPSICIYKGGVTSSSSKGHCVSFYQDVHTLATTLPRLPSDLNIIVIKHPNDRITDKTFTVRRQYLIDALVFLKTNSPDYRDIEIEQENANAYPEDDILQTVREIPPDDLQLQADDPTAENPESTTFNTTTCDMPIPTNTEEENITEVINKGTTDNGEHQEKEYDPEQQQNGHHQQQPQNQPLHHEQPMPWPTRNRNAASEFTPGFFSKSFPDLFPYGRGDITKPRTHKNPSLLDYFQHLMRINRSFVTHHSFTFVATNMWRRHNALTLGNVFTKTAADGLTMKELKTAVENGDDAVLKKLLYFAAPIVGTRQNLRYKSDQALSFVDFVRIDSNDTKMFNMFQTFSAADLHWDDMHRILPGSDQYVNKTVVKSMDDVPDEEDADNFIDSATDFKLRSQAVRDNADVVASYIKQRHSKFLETVMTKLGAEEYIVRYEDQGRGCLHTHDLFVMKDGVSAITLEKAYKKISMSMVEQDIEPIVMARDEVVNFSTKTLGVSATHPNPDPAEWPGPYGANIHTPATNCLRARFLDLDTPEKLKEQHEKLINRTMLHKCRVGYCLSNDVRDKDGNMTCRFHFPMDTFGYNVNYSADGRTITSVTRSEQLQGGAAFVDGNLIYARNHPTLVHHVPELLTCWCANIEGRSVVSYRQVVNYIMKYMMKPEPNSAPFDTISKAIVQDADEDQPVRKAMQKILLKTVGENDMSKQMCHHLLSGNDIVEFSKQPINVNVMRTRRIREGSGNTRSASENYADVYWAREEDPNYAEFCEEFDSGKTTTNPRDLSLYEFSARYTKRWKLTGISKFPHITPNFKHIPKKSGKYHERYLSFLRSILLAHKPGTTFDEISELNDDDLEAEVELFCEGDRCPKVIRDKFHESQTPDRCMDEDDEEEENNNDDVPELLIEPEREQMQYEQDEWMAAVREIVRDNEQIIEQENDNNDYPNILREFNNVDWQSDRMELGLTDEDIQIMPKWLDQQKHENPNLQRDDVTNGGLPNTLNAKQFSTFAIIRDFVQNVQQRGVDNVPQLLLNISGGAGSGKTYLLTVVKRYINETLNTTKFVAAAAPSGTAAFLINGETLHSLLYLPIDNRKCPKLKGEKLSSLQTKMRNVGILFIDEKSMIGQTVFAAVNQRLQEARPHKCTEPFGGISVVLMGDWVQLPPVLDKSLYDSSTKTPIAYNLYQLFKTVVILDVIQRQTDTVFSDELRRLATGGFTKDDWSKWQSRTLDMLPITEQEDFHTNAIMACAIGADMVQHNVRKVRDNQQPIAQIHAENSNSEASKESADKSCNLPKKIILCKNTTVRLTSNLWTSAGLTNGSIGTVRYIIYDTNDKPPQIPTAVIVSFDSYIGPSYLEDIEKCVVITPIYREWISNGITCSRTMLPLILGYALSIHRLQGQTEDKVILNPGEKEFASGLMYVGASRTKSFAGLAFSPFPNFDRFSQISKSNALKKRMAEDNRLRDLQIQTLDTYSDVIQMCGEEYGVELH